MKRVRIIVEGSTEESFVSGPLAQSLASVEVFVTATVLGVPGHRGGRVNFERVRKDILATLRQDAEVYCTTFFDFYGCGDFPLNTAFQSSQGAERAGELERLLRETVAKEIGGYEAGRRFLPYFQLYEFEGLLFSDPTGFAEAILQPRLAENFQAIRDAYPTPEQINDGPATAPSKRILQHFPGYSKVISGNLAAKSIGIQTICAACPRFAHWYATLAALNGASHTITAGE